MYLTEIMYFITHLRPSVLFNSPMTLEEKKKKKVIEMHVAIIGG